MRHRITEVSVSRYPVLHITFDDKISGELDLSAEIENKPMFEELRNKEFFNRVSIDRQGFCVGWKLDQIGKEIDLSADGIRDEIETQMVIAGAARHRAKLQAAE